MPAPGQGHELERAAIGEVLQLVDGTDQLQLLVATTSTCTWCAGGITRVRIRTRCRPAIAGLARSAPTGAGDCLDAMRRGSARAWLDASPGSGEGGRCPTSAAGKRWAVAATLPTAKG